MSDMTLIDPMGFIGDYSIKNLQGNCIKDEKSHQIAVELQIK